MTIFCALVLFSYFWFRKLDPSRLVDCDSGGGANDFHFGDVNDIHTYPYPGHPLPSGTQYAMIGEYGGIGMSPSPQLPFPSLTHRHLASIKGASGTQQK